MIAVAQAGAADAGALQALRRRLWDDAAAAAPGTVAFLAREEGEPIGFAEATVRRDYVNGCEGSPVAFLEGLFVVPAWRRRGVARALVAIVEAWARAEGLGELASDALLANRTGRAAHRALGFAETERVVFFRRAL